MINGFFRAEASGFCQELLESEKILKFYFQPKLVPHLCDCQFGFFDTWTLLHEHFFLGDVACIVFYK